jgi:predicted nicotinamide N-methyase
MSDHAALFVGNTAEAEAATAFIRANLPLAAPALVPEIRLHTAGPSSGLSRLGGSAPFWAWPWPGGEALARHVLDHPETVRDRRALDLGAGSGLVAIAAAKAGARHVLAVDVDWRAAVAIRLNAAANRASLAVLVTDLLGGQAPDVDVILAGDLFYAPQVSRRALEFMDRCRAAGVEIIVGDPGRADLPLSRLRLVAEYAVHDVGDSRAGASRKSAVYSFD